MRPHPQFTPESTPLDEEENAPWRSWANAEAYDQFVRQRSLYGWLNQTLVEFLEVDSATRLLDIGCGTGATTAACLPRMSLDADVVAIDASDEMVAVAASNIVDSRVRFEVMGAAEIEHLEGPFDRFVSNAAFWQFPSPRAVFRAAAGIAAPGALFAFNVPAERVAGERTSIHPIQALLLREIESMAGTRPGAQPTKVELDVLVQQASEFGFVKPRRERLALRCRQDDLLELMSIPAMILPLTPGWAAERRLELQQRVRERADVELRVEVPWVFVALQREG